MLVNFSGVTAPLLIQELMTSTNMHRIRVYRFLQMLRVNDESIDKNRTYQNRPQSSHEYA
jgi:hypothetical protein